MKKTPDVRIPWAARCRLPRFWQRKRGACPNSALVFPSWSPAQRAGFLFRSTREPGAGVTEVWGLGA